jgi:hypothetical protein
MSKPLILASMAFVTVDTGIASLKKSGSASRIPPVRVLVGGWFTTVLLLVLAESQEKIADGLALLMLIATLTGPNNTALLTAISNVTTGKVAVTSTQSKGTK